MGGDYTRVRFDATKRYSGVHQQQGRVSLDADFNEFEEILDRRDRVLALDAMGRAVYPATTKQGFEITVVGGELMIGPGRFYVDGIAAECFGATTGTDPVLGGVRGKDPLPLKLQPCHSALLPARSTDTSKVDLVYLDVWQREVTVAEDAGLREPALGGPDTTTRVQTAWQVSVLPDAGAQACATDTAAWLALIDPSAGTLTTRTITPSKPGNAPCAVDPAGGYLGPENRLYRVEIVRGNRDGGTPTFLWSADNAAHAAVVTGAVTVGTDTTLSLAGLGPGGIKHFVTGRYVQFVDDDIEFGMRHTDRAGAIFPIADTDEAADTVRITGTLPVDPKRHPRIRLWAEAVRDAKGTQKFEADGIELTFGAGLVRAGDHWVFAARAATGRVEELTAVPPRGVLHHFAKLALVSPTARLTECRSVWPPECECGEGGCGVSVAPGENIQVAIDSLAGVGGSVCLRNGVHEISGPLVIRNSDITLHGEASQVRVRAKTVRVLRVEGGNDARIRNVTVSDIRFESGGEANEALFAVSYVDGFRVGRCTLAGPGGGAATGMQVTDCTAVTVEESLVTGVLAGIITNQADPVTVRDNTFRGVGRAVWINYQENQTDPVARRFDVLRNRVVGYYRPPPAEPPQQPAQAPEVPAIQVDLSGVHATRIAANQIDRVVAGILVRASAGVEATGNAITRSVVGIALDRVADCRIAGNTVRSADTGIYVHRGRDTSVDGNLLTDVKDAILATSGTGIRVTGNSVRGGQAGIDLFGEEDGIVAGNVVEGAERVGIICTTPRVGLTVAGNDVRHCGFLPVEGAIAAGIRVDDALDVVTVEDCRVTGTGERPGGDPFMGPRMGIRIERARDGGVLAHVRVHNCQVRGTVVGERHPASRAILVITRAIGDDRAFADLTGNLAELTGRANDFAESVLVEVGDGVTWAEVTFASNTCADLGGLASGPVVLLHGTNHTITGNRTSNADGVSLRVITPNDKGMVTAVGNVCTVGADIRGTLVPQPFDGFNAIL